MTDERPVAPFNRREVSVVSTSSLGPYKLIEVEDLEAPIIRAGQFHMLSAANGWESDEAGRPWLARAISFLSTDNAGRIVFLVDAVGPGTEALANLSTGDALQVVGPLGNGFPEPAEGLRPLLVGGGIGLAPILALSDQLNRAGTSHDLVLGFRTGDHAAAVAEREGVILATDDGSVGHHGTVIQPAELLLAEGEREVFACGPPAMMNAIKASAEQFDAPIWLALESPMACGFGACFGCAVETREGIIRLCVDGPVINGALLKSVSATGRSS